MFTKTHKIQDHVSNSYNTAEIIVILFFIFTFSDSTATVTVNMFLINVACKWSKYVQSSQHTASDSAVAKHV